MTSTTTPPRPPATGDPADGRSDDPVAVDPRFRQRRAQVRKQEGRRRLHTLTAVGVAIALVVAAAALTYSPVLDVDAITVSGGSRVSADEVSAVAGIRLGDPILFADLGTARTAIESLAWVDTAEVTRSLPGTIDITVTERQPFALVSHDAGDVLVDESGRVLGPADGDPAAEGLVAVVIEDPGVLVPGTSVDRITEAAIELAGRLRDNPAEAVAAVVLAPDLHLELVDGGTVLFGDDQDLDQKVEDFRTLFARVDRSCLATIDVRVPGRSVLTRSEPCS